MLHKNVFMALVPSYCVTIKGEAIMAQSKGYRLVRSILGTECADRLADLASSNARNQLYIPLYAESARRIKHVLTEKELQKLVQALGGERICISHVNLLHYKCELRRRVALELETLGYSEDDIAFILQIKTPTLQRYKAAR